MVYGSQEWYLLQCHNQLINKRVTPLHRIFLNTLPSLDFEFQIKVQAARLILPGVQGLGV
jgi:hypothetical protein